MKKNVKPIIISNTTTKISCKKCGASSYSKSGTTKTGKLRYLCKGCGCYFSMGDNRFKQSTAQKRALAILMYTMGRMSFRRIGKILSVDHTQVYRWIRETAEQLPEPTIDPTITEVEIDEMWHFIKDKKISFGSSKQLIGVRGELSPGLQVLVVLKQSENSTTN